MNAIVHNRYGLPDKALELSQVDEPIAKDDEVLVHVHAAGVAIGDWLTVRGLPYLARAQYGLLKPKSRIAGFEIAGRVEAVGKRATQLGPNDEVFGWCAGAFAEYVAVSERQLAPKPSNLTFEQAAAVPISGLAALQALRDKGELQPGDRTLIIGASGAVGTFAVQIAKALGADVTAVCSTRNVEMVRSIGADQFIDYTTEDITRSDARHDLILDMAGNRSLSVLRRALTSKGTLVIVGGSGGPVFMGLGRTIRASLISPFVSQRLRPFISTPKQKDLVALKELIEAGKVTPVIDRTFPLSSTVQAIAYVGERHTQGKTVIRIGNS